LVTLADRDNLLPVDLENIFSIESFVQLTKDREMATLLELFPGPDELCAFGPDGSFFHQLIVPFVSGPLHQNDVAGPPVTDLGRSNESNLRRRPLARRFTPGSQWLYVKLYTGPATADRLLRDLVKPLVKQLKKKGDVNRWFFIRYSDPDFHLRLRLHGEPNCLRDCVQPLLKDALTPFIADNRIWRVQFDTYEREVERYGGPEGITLSEQLFQIDSEAVLDLIEMLEPGDAGADERWLLAVYGIDGLLDDFGFKLNMKHSIVKEIRDAFAKEFGMDEGLQIQLNEKFREEKNALQSLLDAAVDGDHPLSPGLAVLRNRSRKISGIVRELRSSEQQGRLSQTLIGLMPVYIHMHANRLLRYAHREQELVIYHLLTRFYESRLKQFSAGAGDDDVGVNSL